MKEVRAVWESADEELVAVSVEDKKGWILRKDYEQLATSNLGRLILLIYRIYVGTSRESPKTAT